jgi:hypothetical protein
MIASTTRSQLRHCLNDIRFPASKDDLLDAAIRNGCDDDTIGALRAVAPVTYSNATQVLASATIVASPDGDLAAARRSHAMPSHAESTSDVAAGSPNVEEQSDKRDSEHTDQTGQR